MLKPQALHSSRVRIELPPISCFKQTTNCTADSSGAAATRRLFCISEYAPGAIMSPASSPGWRITSFHVIKRFPVSFVINVLSLCRTIRTTCSFWCRPDSLNLTSVQGIICNLDSCDKTVPLSFFCAWDKTTKQTKNNILSHKKTPLSLIREKNKT